MKFELDPWIKQTDLDKKPSLDLIRKDYWSIETVRSMSRIIEACLLDYQTLVIQYEDNKKAVKIHVFDLEKGS